jgi:4-hydroxybenzoate polyprenyltransferase
LLTNLIIALRPHQWLKGIFIFCPIIFGRKLFDPVALQNTIAMFFLFNFTASAMYLINDIIDLKEDRLHPEKSKRPLAAGKISIPQALITAAFITVATLFLSFQLKYTAGLLILFYIAFNYFYMRYLKNAVIIDVFCLGAFFYLRLLAGQIASGVPLSSWILMCTVLLAMFLGFNKRRADLELAKNHREVFTKYNQYFLDRMISIIAASLVMAYGLYVMEPETVERFGSRNLIYSVPFVYYGIFRYIYLIDTKWFGADPAKIILGDYKIQLSMALWLLVCVLVIYFKL